VQVLGGDKLRPRGKEKTHLALVGAAQNLLATGTTTASIQEITELAGVGFGSFYNHFESKEQLFAEAVSSTLDAFDEFRDRA
jgi:AcrR family transcriptional regulator